MAAAAFRLAIAVVAGGCRLGDSGLQLVKDPGITAAMSQNWPLPFSQEEFLAAYRLVMPEEDARQLVAEMSSRFQKTKQGNIEGHYLPPGTLDLLAGVSEDLSKRVQSFREHEARASERAAEKREEWLRRNKGKSGP